MTQYRALRIPAPLGEPVELVTYDDSRADNLQSLVGADVLDFATFGQHGIQLVFDDMGLMRDEIHVNRRAMTLWASLAGRSTGEFRQPLVGTYVVLGVDMNGGETMDVPDTLVLAMNKINAIIDKMLDQEGNSNDTDE